MGNLLHEMDEIFGRLDFVAPRLHGHLAAIKHDKAIGNIENVVDIVADEDN